MNNWQKKQIQRALDNPDKLSEWEYDFVNSLADQDEAKVLSEKQNQILNRIAEKVA